MVLWSALSALGLLVAGWYGRDIVKLLRTRSRLLLVRRRRKRMLLERETAHRWVTAYYHATDPDSLFRLPNGRPIPYLTKPTWRFPRLALDSLRFECSEDRSPATVERRSIASRRRHGQRVWDGEVFCLRHGIVEDHGEIRIDLQRGSYFQYISMVDRLAREAAVCARAPARRPSVRDTIARSIWDLQSGRPQAQLIGFAVVFLLAGNDGWRVLIQRRSFETGVAADLHAVVPAYVVEPVDSNGRPVVTPFNDFLREASEELYASRHHADPNAVRDDWYLENEDVRRLRDHHAAGRLHFEILGFGFDAVTAELNVAAVAAINDPDTARSELRLMQTNWEVAGVRAYDIESPDIETILNSTTIYPTSAFALSCAREWLRSHHASPDRPGAGT